jgi:hypothetical protein
MKNKEEPLSQENLFHKLSPKHCITTSDPEVPENELLRLLNKLEHRVEVLMAIAHHQRASGCYESAEAYKKQAMESKGHAESIRKLLKGHT